MTWSYDSEFTMGCDREAGIYLDKSGYQRDNFEFLIKYIDSAQLYFMFYAKPVGERRLSDSERLLNPEYDLSTTWEVSCIDKFDERSGLIHDALVAYTHRVDGYSHKTDGEWFKSRVVIERVDIVKGY